MARRRRRSDEAVSSLAAVTAPAAASSGLSDAGASSTGKCRAMNPAARGLAAIRDDPSNRDAQVAPLASLTANPAGRKYPSAALTSALDPSDRNKGWSTSSLYTGYSTSSATGWPFPGRPTTPAPLARPAATGRPSGSRSGGAGSPTRSASGHIA